jgi:hypothetical protein
MPTEQVERDRAELQLVLRGRIIAGMDKSDAWVRSQGFCLALDALLAKVQQFQLPK